MMVIHSAKPLFAWDSLKDSPSLKTVKDLLAAIPDGKLLNSLRAARDAAGAQRLLERRVRRIWNNLLL